MWLGAAWLALAGAAPLAAQSAHFTPGAAARLARPAPAAPGAWPLRITNSPLSNIQPGGAPGRAPPGCTRRGACSAPHRRRPRASPTSPPQSWAAAWVALRGCAEVSRLTALAFGGGCAPRVGGRGRGRAAGCPQGAPGRPHSRFSGLMTSFLAPGALALPLPADIAIWGEKGPSSAKVIWSCRAAHRLPIAARTCTNLIGVVGLRSGKPSARCCRYSAVLGL